MQIMHLLHKLTLSTTKWPKGRKKMCTGAKDLGFVLSDYSFKERNQGRFELFSKINAILGVSLRQSVYDIQRKVQFMYNLCMNRASLDCESLDPVS